MTITKKSISALVMQRQLGLNRREPALYMMHKLRVAMGTRDSKYELSGDVKLDDAFITVIRIDKDKNDPPKRGRGSQKKRSILVMVSKETIETKKGKNVQVPQFVKLLAMDNLDELSITDGVFESVHKANTNIKSDAYPAFRKFKNLVRSHKPKVTPPNKGHVYLKWVHCVIGNLKRITNGIHHHINDENLQLYLNEFAYKFNQRNFDCRFDNILKAGIAIS